MRASPSPAASHSPATPCSAAAARFSRPDAPGDGCRGAVREEVEDAEGGRQDRPGDGETGERFGAEAPNDRGVGEHIQRLGDERPERGQRQAPDVPVVGMGAERRRPVARR